MATDQLHRDQDVQTCYGKHVISCLEQVLQLIDGEDVPPSTTNHTRIVSVEHCLRPFFDAVVDKGIHRRIKAKQQRVLQILGEPLREATVADRRQSQSVSAVAERQVTTSVSFLVLHRSM